jgi:glycosyltransferase involved in cell wall biosynthesis
MSKILVATERYYPYLGGRESYSNWIVKEMTEREHEVTVLASIHKGGVDGITVTSDYISELEKIWDLIIVVGYNGQMPKLALRDTNPHTGNKLIINTSDIPENVAGSTIPITHHLSKPSVIGYSTKEEYRFIENKKYSFKSKKINTGIPKTSISVGGFRSMERIETRNLFISVGGFDKDSKMLELYNTFIEAEVENATLALFGYKSINKMPKEYENVRVFSQVDYREIQKAIKDADLCIMNGENEGLGLAFFESMINETLWVSKPNGVAKELQKFGTIYNSQDELAEIMTSFQKNDETKKDLLKNGKQYVIDNHLISNTVDSIEKLIEIPVT